MQFVVLVEVQPLLPRGHDEPRQVEEAAEHPRLPPLPEGEEEQDAEEPDEDAEQVPVPPALLLEQVCPKVIWANKANVTNPIAIFAVIFYPFIIRGILYAILYNANKFVFFRFWKFGVMRVSSSFL